MAWRQRLVFPAMAIVSLVLAHNLVYVLNYGSSYQEALADSGHGDAWRVAVLVVLSGAVGLLAISLWRLHRLGMLVRRLASGTADGWAASRGLTGLGSLWLRLAVTTTLLFITQENLEQIQTGETPAGLGVLGARGGLLTLLVVAGVALAVALVAELLRWRRAVLVNQITAALRRLRRRPLAGRFPPANERDLRPDSIVSRGLAVRAPPMRRTA